jgi:glutathione synthase
MQIAFFVNGIKHEYPRYTTTVLARAALARGHDISYVTPGDFVLRADDSLCIRTLRLPKSRYKTVETLHKALQGKDTSVQTIDATELDVLFLRHDPSLDAEDHSWAAHAPLMFGRLAAKRGVLVVNDPDGLSNAQNKLYLQGFPEAVRPTTLISRSIDEVRAFVADQPKGVIVKPLQGSGGKHVFKINSATDANLNQIVEAVGEEGYLIAQAYLPKAKGGDVRLFVMNGVPLEREGVYAALHRIPAKGDIRSNMHAKGTAEKVTPTGDMLKAAELVRPKLLNDGMFLVGLDLVGDRILEINVFTPGGLWSICDLYGIDFAESIIVALENKLAIRDAYVAGIANKSLASL